MAILLCFTAGTFIAHASSPLQTGSGACRHPTAPFAGLGVFVHALYRGGNQVRRAGRSKRGRERRQGRAREARQG